MALFEKNTTATTRYPTEQAFLIPVEIRPTPQYGDNHHGIFALESIQKGTKFWEWNNDLIISIHYKDLPDYIKENVTKKKEEEEESNEEEQNRKEIQIFLRQGFVLPDKDDYFHSNPTDAGRFMNHSNEANCGPDGTLRDVEAGEELTMDYSFHGNPQWYSDICKKYGVKTEREIAAEARGGA